MVIPSVCPTFGWQSSASEYECCIGFELDHEPSWTLVIPHEGDLQMIRLLCTDLRRYLLPLGEETNDHEKELGNEKDKAKTFLISV